MNFKVENPNNKKTKKRREPITYYELVELENQKNRPPVIEVKIKKKFPIAPDGFIPNSIVQKFFTLFEPEPEAPPPIWRLNWVNTINYLIKNNFF